MAAADVNHVDPTSPADHTGNLMPALPACPNAVLVTTWFGVGRMVDHFEIPMDRVRFVRDGDSFDALDDVAALAREAFDVLGSAPHLDPWPEFSQQDLDRWMAAAGTGAA